MTESSPPPNVLFYEQGASWLWVLTGPAAGIAMLLIQISAGLGIQWIVPTAFFALVTSFVAVQVKAARIHTSVELTPTTLREGTEITEIDDIVRIYPEPTGPDAPKWQSARALGELAGVPKGRTGIGLKHQQLRSALVHLMDERIPPEPKP